MAVLIEFVSVIFRKTAVELDVRGGIDAVAQLRLPNFIEDEHLIRIGFMSTREAVALLSEVESMGLPTSKLEINAAILQWNVLPYPTWLSVGVHEEHRACWLAGELPGALVKPENSVMLMCPDATAISLPQRLKVIAAVSCETPPDERFIEVTFARGDAATDVQLIENDEGVYVLLTCKISRRRERTFDSALRRELIENVVRLGAKALT